ncbi:hypothetical protein K2173_025021 [Erythroxylum novogranatense]|uniref:Uncharacterized protein n=1 Tax=Erythroxylum novogranatense TaxID=1862640 RepID=A0AAV8UD74_9ROSI|nr:hypothetical protein K2173_025021 [Erythroxylum novogranatense]
MGGKGRRRREKNYRAAHGGDNRLPPPPDFSKVDALPTKLRKIMSFNTLPDNDTVDPEKKRKTVEGDAEKAKNGFVQRRVRKDDLNLSEVNSEGDIHLLPAPSHSDSDDDKSMPDMQDEEKKKNKKKRKRKQAEDLRFDTIVGKSRTSEKRSQRKKKYLQAKKKKHNKSESGTGLDFPGREQVKFGDVVQAPPKLIAVPKVRNLHDASKERLRLQAVEAYRNRKGWKSRPGLELPPPVTSIPSL